VSLLDISAAPIEMLPTGLGEVDRVLAGGIVPGSTTLLAGPPGIGKSTLVLQLSGHLARAGHVVLYVCAEEAVMQVRRRAERLDAVASRLWLAGQADLPSVRAHIDQVDPDVVVVDSVQTLFDPEIGSAAGTVSQVRACAAELVARARDDGRGVVLVGHVTKDGDLAGPRVLEHLVDTVLAFEGDRHHSLRMLRARKHRHGATGELGLLEMTETGLVSLDDPSRVFLGDRRPIPGSVVAPVLAGERAMLVELQALLVPSVLAVPRRVTRGLDTARLDTVVAVLARRAGVDIGRSDIYASSLGGLRVVEPAADLGLLLAVASAWKCQPLPPDLVVHGEVGLGGEVRQVVRSGQRLAEAARLGYRGAIVPASTGDGPPGLELIPVSTVEEAVACLAHRAVPGVPG
jgi:DNA repair protein RadA/Sms